MFERDGFKVFQYNSHIKYVLYNWLDEISEDYRHNQIVRCSYVGCMTMQNVL